MLLHVAAANANIELVRLLLAANSNPNEKNSVSSPLSANVTDLCSAELCCGFMQREETPLQIAETQGHSDCVKLLKPVTDSGCTIQ